MNYANIFQYIFTLSSTIFSWLLAGDGDMIITMGNGNSVNDLSALKQAMDEIAGQRHLTEKAQEQIDELLKQQRILIEALAGKKP